MKKHLFLIWALLFATVAKAQLSGTYTINSNASQNPDFTSFGAAVSALSAGVSGQVIFQVAPGTYEEYVNLNVINGANDDNRVIFRGMGADNQQVIITSNAGYTDNSTLTLNSTDYVTFENMTITTTSSNKAVLLKVNGNTNYVRFYDIRFVGAVSNTSLENDKDLVYYNDGEWTNLNNEFVGCEFVNGYIGLYYQGHNIYTLNDGLLVENCTFTNQSFKSIYISFTDHVTIRGNTVTNHTHDVLTNYHAMDLLRIRYHCIIENNVMNVTRNSNYATAFEIRPAMGTEEEPIIIRNNIINFNSHTNSSYCVDLDDSNSSYVYFVNNTVRCYGPNPCGSIIVEKTWPELHLYNNLIINETGGYVFRFQNGINDRYSDYNRIQFNGNFIGRVSTTDYATLANWTAATGFDSHSALCTPQFVGDNDLHLTSNDGLTVANPLPYVTTDIDGETRSNTPCAGADEYLTGTNLPPVVAHPISDVVFESYPAAQTIDLTNTFDDPDDPNEEIVISVFSNSNPDLVGTTLNNRSLQVQRLLETGGHALITLQANSNGQSVQTSFNVECIAEDLPPVVANPLAPINFTEYPQTLNFDLSNVFDDPDNNNQFMVYSVQSCPSEIAAFITDLQLTVSRTTPNAFSNKTLVIRATSNDQFVDMDVTVSGAEVVVNGEVADFEDVVVGPNGYWESADGYHNMLSGAWVFTHYYSEDIMFWGGFSASNHTDLNQTGMNAQYTAITGGGYEGSSQYAVAYTMGAPTEVSAADGQAHTVTGCYVTNNLWAYQDMVEGEYNVTPFGGATGNDPDWFKLTATGKNSNGQTVGTLDFFLADYRFANSDDDYILDTWEWFDLSPLGEVASISFSLTSSKNNNWGMITPAYFCMDNFNGTPSGQDLPPYIANPVEDLIFEDYPQTIQINLAGVATDPDDDDESIVYSLVSNSNPSVVTASLDGTLLTLTRQDQNAATASLVIRATSDGQSVDFNIQVILRLYTGMEEYPLQVKVYPNPVTDRLTLLMQGADTFDYQVYDLLGQVVVQGQASGQEVILEVGSWVKGLYFVRITHHGHSFIKKVTH